MPRTASTAIENSFVNGWVTEATGLNFPENAVTDAENFNFEVTGRLERRLGIDLESEFEVQPNPQAGGACSEYLWETVGGDGNFSFHVQQFGATLRFFRVVPDSSLSGQLYNTFDLTPFIKGDPANFARNTCQFASGFGRLFVVHPYMNPIYLTYTQPTTIAATPIEIVTRDYKRQAPYPTARLPTLSTTHDYNLRNQGWEIGRTNRFRDKAGVYPSDYDVWWLYKAPDPFGAPAYLPDTSAAGLISTVDRGNSLAPNGSVTLSEFYQDRSAATGVPGISVVTSGDNRPSTCAFFAGRVWYSGVNSQDYSSKLYFSQIIQTLDQAGRCFTENDPTSEYQSDLLPTDGGVIDIAEIGQVIKLWSIEGSLIVFASNGAWQITGSTGIGFAANDYTVKKISKIKAISPYSFVDVSGIPMWWGEDAIYTLSVESTTGTLEIRSLTDDRLKTYYRDLSSAIKYYAKGAFNLKDRLVQWVYREEPGAAFEENFIYDSVLNFRVTNNTFFRWSIPVNHVRIKGILSAPGFGSATSTEAVVDQNGVVVTALDASTVTVEVDFFAPVTSQFTYVVSIPPHNNVTFATAHNTNYIDWAGRGAAAQDAFAYFTTGYRLRGDAQRKFQSNYLVVYGEGPSTEFHIQGRWDYAIEGDTGRWSSRQKIAFDRIGYDYDRKRIKIRGSGLSLQYHVQSIPTKPVDLIGWSEWATTNGSL